jgi:hypothetical protein
MTRKLELPRDLTLSRSSRYFASKESFESYLKDNKEEIIELVNNSKNFKELKKGLAEKLGIGLRHWGTDLAFYDLNDRNLIISKIDKDKSDEYERIANPKVNINLIIILIALTIPLAITLWVIRGNVNTSHNQNTITKQIQKHSKIYRHNSAIKSGQQYDHRRK